MKIRLDTVLTDFKGVPLKDGAEEVTLGVVCLNALLIPNDEEKDMKQKIMKYRLAQDIYDTANAEFTAEDIVLIKKCINVAYTQPIIVGQACDLLEQKEKED